MIKKYRQPISTESWLQEVAKVRSQEDILLLQHAIDLSGGKEAESTIKGLMIADILFQMKMDSKSLAASLMYPAFKLNEIHHDKIADHFGEDIKVLLTDTLQMQSLEKIQQAASRGHHQVENLRKLLLAMVSDIRAVLIILAERLISLRQAKDMDVLEQKKLAKETISIYAPLANRLGVWQLKWEIEDLCFRYLEPDTYKNIATLLASKRDERESYIAEAIKALTDILNKHAITGFKVTGRVKHIYSIYSKMLRKNTAFKEIYDITAMRVLVNSVNDCYSVLSILQNEWQQIPEEFDDYISQPKANGYQSLHTLILGPKQQIIEVQIRTHKMHQECELGVAAHWQYKEGILETSNYESKIALLRQVMAWQNDIINEVAQETQEPVKDLFADRIYVFTPLGDIIDLPQGATPLDFAYHIHSEVGHRCRGAKVDGKMIPLTYVLKTGERVEILTNKQHHPSRDWLNPNLGYIKTAKARSHLQHWFRLKDAASNAALEKATPEKQTPRPKPKEKLLEELSLLNQPATLNVSNFLTKVARCCKPLPGDAVIGYITQRSGLSIHRQNCPNLSHLNEQNKERFIEINLSHSSNGRYPVDLEVLAVQHSIALRDITAALADIQIQIAGFKTHSTPNEREWSFTLTLIVPDVSGLNKAIHTLEALPNIITVHRA